MQTKTVFSSSRLISKEQPYRASRISVSFDAIFAIAADDISTSAIEKCPLHEM